MAITSHSSVPDASTLVSRGFYDRSPELVAPALLGKLVVRTLNGERLLGRITETEAYLGLDDPAAHAFAGRTERNAVLFGPPGFAYVYFIYGIHYCLNFSCQPEGLGEGVLIRALYPMAGIPTMARLRGVSPDVSAKVLTGGPGRLCQALGITRLSHNGVDVTAPVSSLQVRDDGFTPARIETTARVGISKAKDRPLRFLAR